MLRFKHLTNGIEFKEDYVVQEKVTTGVCASCQSPAVVGFVPHRPSLVEWMLSDSSAIVDDQDLGDVYMGPHFVANTDIPCEGYGTTPQSFIGN